MLCLYNLFYSLFPLLHEADLLKNWTHYSIECPAFYICLITPYVIWLIPLVSVFSATVLDKS